MTRKELAEFDGREGRRAYVAVSGNIYDFTDSNLWQNGDHQGAHQAGLDLTEELKDAPHVRAVIERFPVIGKLEEIQAPEKGGSKVIIVTIAALVILAIVAALVF